MSQNNNITPHDAEFRRYPQFTVGQRAPAGRFLPAARGSTLRLPADKPACGAFAKLVDEAEEHIRDITEFA